MHAPLCVKMTHQAIARTLRSLLLVVLLKLLLRPQPVLLDRLSDSHSIRLLDQTDLLLRLEELCSVVPIVQQVLWQGPKHLRNAGQQIMLACTGKQGQSQVELCSHASE
jgi:hypothetical protein